MLEQRGVEVVDVHGILGDVIAVIIRRAVFVARLESAFGSDEFDSGLRKCDPLRRCHPTTVWERLNAVDFRPAKI